MQTDRTTVSSLLSPTRVFIVGSVAVLAIVLFITSFMAFEHMNAGEIMVVQSPVKGTLTWHTSAGIKWQGFGTVTKYKKRTQFWFSAKGDQGASDDQSIKVRFNDKGHANLSGSVSWEMPLDETHLTLIHTNYGSQGAVEQQLIRTVVEKVVYMTGPLMSSQESAAERRNELLQFIEDQITSGIYKTQTVQEKQPDPITGQLKTVSVVKLVMDGTNIARSDVSPLKTFGILTFNPSLNEIKYDPVVEAQIVEQQKATMAVTTSAANAKKAEQDAITAGKNGEAEAAKAKWEQEVIKARVVVEAQQRLDIATLDAKAAEQTKRKLILEGEGEAQKRQLVMNADGALDKKLAAYVETNKLYADAIKGYQGNWVPGVVMGGQGGGQSTAGSGAMTLMELLSIKAARDLGLDMSVGGSAKTAGKK